MMGTLPCSALRPGACTRMVRRALGARVSMVALCIGILVLAAPIAAVGATGGFTSSTVSPAVSAHNSSGASGAKAVFGTASAARGMTYGVYGSAASPQGYGVFSAGRLGVKGLLVCAKCVTAGDINAAGFPTVPSAQNATALGGEPSSYYGHVESFSVSSSPTADMKLLGTYDGLDIGFKCVAASGNSAPWVGLFIRAASSAADGYMTLSNGGYGLAPAPITPDHWMQPLSQPAIVQQDGTTTEAAAMASAMYVNAGTGATVTLTYLVDVDSSHCQVAGQVVSNG